MKYGIHDGRGRTNRGHFTERPNADGTVDRIEVKPGANPSD